LSLFLDSYSLLFKQALLSHIKKKCEVHGPINLKYFLRGMKDTYNFRNCII